MTTSGFDIDELERLLAAATPGEWVTGCGFERNYLYGGGAHLACIGGSEDYEINDDGSPNEADNNADLIAAARNSLPAILTEIRELRAENARLREVASSFEITGPDDDSMIWLALRHYGVPTGGQALIHLGKSTPGIMGQLAIALEEARRAALGEPQ